MFESFKQTGRLVTNSQKFETMRMFFGGGEGRCVGGWVTQGLELIKMVYMGRFCPKGFPY